MRKRTACTQRPCLLGRRPRLPTPRGLISSRPTRLIFGALLPPWSLQTPNCALLPTGLCCPFPPIPAPCSAALHRLVNCGMVCPRQAINGPLLLYTLSCPSLPVSPPRPLSRAALHSQCGDGGRPPPGLLFPTAHCAHKVGLGALMRRAVSVLSFLQHIASINRAMSSSIWSSSCSHNTSRPPGRGRMRALSTHTHTHTHIHTRRQVVNPFEEEGVVGITNYVDVGLQLTTAIGGTAPEGPGAKGDGGGGGGGAAAERPGVNLAASWQVRARACGEGVSWDQDRMMPCSEYYV